ncbi:GIY-YIG nuclease family protein [Streptomyces sp. NPDC052000]|uniref:GIY-YIG nuclease family protein n=1 Tax=Streptomyces sp. NPDC052000 TaxID=3155676 RepID=UPI00344DFE45
MDRIPPATYEEARERTDSIRAGFDEIRRLQQLLPPQPKRKEADKRSVYFIEADSGLIKIGVAANPKDRIRTLRTMSPVALRLVLVLPDRGAAGESELHARFAEHRSHGEWFHPAPELIRFIQEQK